jgi:hypothetical protein
MLRKSFQLPTGHIPDEELLRSVDGELSPRRAPEVNAHLEACWDCRARMAEIEAAIADFARAHHAQFDAQLPGITGSRALLRARLGNLASERQTKWWERVLQFSFNPPRVALVCLALIAAAAGILLFRHSTQRDLMSAASDAQVAPDRRLTPGATRQVTISEVCSAPQEQVVGDVSISLRDEVFHEYGIANARPEDYEIDYLIAPRLGGTEDIRNLWPEPYRGRVWNAHVKDALEERLHELVCSGQLDLSTAQHDIAADWIAAYKKYFHTNRPIPLSSPADSIS